MKRLCGLTLALLFCSGGTLWAEDPAIPAVEAGTEEAGAYTVFGEPFVWPVAATIGGRRIKIVSKFGKRKLPAIPGLSTETVKLPADEAHTGIDFAVPPDAQVRAACSGKVLFAGYSSEYVSRKDKKDKHHLVIVRHADGKSTRYVHLNRLQVKPGLDVKVGTVLGTTASSDEWKEPVLHFEIRESNGQPVDPEPYLGETLKNP
jgi:murein DD-endopeptidase MepM/ murein hydrolase activator NlpD